MKSTTEDIMEAAKEGAKKAGYLFVKITKIAPPNGKENWDVEIDVGVTEEKKKTIIIDDETRKIISIS